MKIACGLVRPTGGSAAVCGHPAGSPAAHASLGYLAELFRFPDWCTADELLALHQRLTGSAGGREERRALLELVELGHVPDRRVGAMSKGMQQRLGLAQALIGDPRLLLLDEPTSALDPAGRHMVRALLERLRERGVTVLLNSHLLSEVELVCDRVAIIDGGEVVAAGTPAELSRAGGVEVETADGWRTLPDAPARGRAADRARARRGRRGRLRRARSSPRRSRTPTSRRSGARRRSRSRERAGRARPARRAARRADRRRLLAARVAAPARVRRHRPAHARLPRALRARHLAGVRGRRRLRPDRVRRRARRRGRRDARRPGDVRDPLPRRDPRRVPDARRGARRRRPRAAAAAARPPAAAPHAAARPLARRHRRSARRT